MQLLLPEGFLLTELSSPLTMASLLPCVAAGGKVSAPVMTQCHIIKLRSLLLTLLVLATVIVTTLHVSHRHEAGHNPLNCSICLLHQALSVTLPLIAVLLPKPVVIEPIQSFFIPLFVSSQLSIRASARGPPSR